MAVSLPRPRARQTEDETEKSAPSAIEPTKTEKTAPRIARKSLYADAPASVADIVTYTRSGSWMPGQAAPVLEALGKAYGYAVAVPASLALYTVAWLVQRPARLGLAVVIGSILWASRTGRH